MKTWPNRNHLGMKILKAKKHCFILKLYKIKSVVFFLKSLLICDVTAASVLPIT